MDRMVKVVYKDNITKEFPVGTSLSDMKRSFQKYYNYPILAAKVDCHIDNLQRQIDRKCNVDFFDRSSVEGNTIYSSSVQFMLILAVKRVLDAYKEFEKEIEDSKWEVLQTFEIADAQGESSFDVDYDEWWDYVLGETQDWKKDKYFDKFCDVLYGYFVKYAKVSYVDYILSKFKSSDFFCSKISNFSSISL